MKIKKLENITLEALLGNTKEQFVIEVYQRPYAWELTQISDFFTDITDAFRRNDDGYFLGTFVLVEVDEDRRYDVLDGQQRLTTITIVLSVLRDLMKESYPAIAQEIHQNLLHAEYSPKILGQRYVKNSFEEAFLDWDVNDSALKRLTPSFSLAKKYFQNELQNFQADGGNLADLYHYLLRRVSIVTMVTTDHASASIIFERLNYRGLELSAKDLLKNYLVRELKLEIESAVSDVSRQQSIIEEETDRFAQDWDRAEKSLLSLDEALTTHIEVKTGKRVSKDTFKEITNYIKDSRQKPKEFLKDLLATIDAYESLLRGEVRDDLTIEAKTLLKLLPNLQNRFWQPILIAAVRTGYKGNELSGLIFHIERLFALSKIAGDASTKLRTPALRIVQEYILRRASVDEIRATVDFYIDRFQILDRALNNLNGDCYGEAWCKYALIKYEYALTDSSVDRVITFSKNIQLEHILPQTLRHDYWKTRFTTDDHERLVNTIGNLTLLIGSVRGFKGSKNQAASNKPFVEKIAVYLGETLKDGASAFFMTSQLKEYPEWTPDIVTTRSRQIVTTLLGLWGINAEEVEARHKERTATFAHDSMSFSVGSYSVDELEDRLLATLAEDGKVIAYLRSLLSILAKESEPLGREIVKKKLYEDGVGEDPTATGRLMSNISQLLTRKENDHLRQIVRFTSDVRPGAPKDDYYIPEEYKEMVRNVIVSST